MAEGASGLVTILFTDLVGSTELLARAGDEDAQQIFRAHRRLLTDAVAVHGGHEVKWLGDGLMVAFASAADAVGCAIDMQQASRRPVEGEELAIRVGLNAGEALDETLWVLERSDHIDVIERALRDKVLGPDFRASGVDGRLAIARLCAVSGRFDEAASWFAVARRVLADQGARPLLAIADHDEALMLARRAGPGDTDRAFRLLEGAGGRFEALAMTGWTRQAEQLAVRLERQ